MMSDYRRCGLLWDTFGDNDVDKDARHSSSSRGRDSLHQLRSKLNAQTQQLNRVWARLGRCLH